MENDEFEELKLSEIWAVTFDNVVIFLKHCNQF